MRSTLNLCDALLLQAKRYMELGVHQEALPVLRRLARLQEIPAETGEACQRMLGEIRLKMRKFARARRHLAVAIAYQPERADYHFLMGEAVYAEQEGDLGASLRHFRRCITLEPNNTRYLCEYGLVAIEVGKDRVGLSALRKARKLEPGSADTVSKVVEGLRLLGRSREAEKTLIEARFRNPREQRFIALMQEQKFQQLHESQQRWTTGEAQKQAKDDGPVLLPFVLPKKPSGKQLRRDSAGPINPPHSPTKSASRPRRD